MVKVFQRACTRAGIKVIYSEGFNPHQKLSLPLPKSVGIEVDDDLLCLQITQKIETQEHERMSALCIPIKQKLSQRLPDGFELLTAEIAQTRTSTQPCQATYLLAVREEFLNEKLKNRIEHLLANKNLNIQRRSNSKSPAPKNINVRPFLKSIELDNRNIAVECKISSVGSLRVDEILELLELNYGMLSEPIRRTNVQWQGS